MSNGSFIDFVKHIESISPPPIGPHTYVGYGHRLNQVEQASGMVYGCDIDMIDPKTALTILHQDMVTKQNQLKQMIPSWKTRSVRQKELIYLYDKKKDNDMLDAILSRDVETQLKLYKWTHRNEKGNEVEAEDLNKAFYSRYFSPVALRGWGTP